MHVFVTGASGHIGSAVVPELRTAGHTVSGLARSDASADALEQAGAEVVRGDLRDLDTLRSAAAAADGVIHLAFRHELMQTGDMQGAVDSDLAAITAMGEVLKGSDKPFVGTSGTLLLAFIGHQGVGTEDVVAPSSGRAAAENAVVDLAGEGVRSSVVRLPPTVHSSLDRHGFVPGLVGFARAQGHAGYVGDGANRWPAVDTYDAARAYRLALETAPAGSRLHAVADEGVPFKEIATAIGEGLGVPVRSVAEANRDAYFSYLSLFVGLDNPTSSERTRQLLGWAPERPGLLADLRAGHYTAA